MATASGKVGHRNTPAQKVGPRRRIVGAAVAILLAGAATTAVISTLRPAPSQTPVPVAARIPLPSSLNDLLSMTQADLEKVDLAVVNLLCAQGLPGAENLDVKHAVATLDRWADVVKSETERHLYRVTDPRYAADYRHSEAYLRALFVVQVLYENFGVKYNPALAGNTTFDFKDSRVAFIHGMIPGPGQSMADTPGGTCASMPVIVAALGRRLGYPMKLVTTKNHIFVRWDGEAHPNPAWRERFNMETTHGFSSEDDDYYKSWPAKLTDDDVRRNHYLVSLTRDEEFADFLAARGHCNLDNGRVALAARCYENAHRYDPRKPDYQDWFVEAALKSAYRPDTPALAQLLSDRSRPRFVRRPMIDPGVPRPGETFPMAQIPGNRSQVLGP